MKSAPAVIDVKKVKKIRPSNTAEDVFTNIDLLEKLANHMSHETKARLSLINPVARQVVVYNKKRIPRASLVKYSKTVVPRFIELLDGDEKKLGAKPGNIVYNNITNKIYYIDVNHKPRDFESTFSHIQFNQFRLGKIHKIYIIPKELLQTNINSIIDIFYRANIQHFISANNLLDFYYIIGSIGFEIDGKNLVSIGITDSNTINHIWYMVFINISYPAYCLIPKNLDIEKSIELLILNNSVIKSTGNQLYNLMQHEHDNKSINFIKHKIIKTSSSELPYHGHFQNQSNIPYLLEHIDENTVKIHLFTDDSVKKIPNITITLEVHPRTITWSERLFRRKTRFIFQNRINYISLKGGQIVNIWSQNDEDEGFSIFLDTKTIQYIEYYGNTYDIPISCYRISVRRRRTLKTSKHNT